MSNQANRPRHWKLWTVLGLAVVAGAVIGMTSLLDARSEPPIGTPVATNQQVSMDQINHAPFDQLLRKYVDDDGYVNYQAWQRSAADRQQLKTYLASLSKASTTKPARKSAQLAFWINAYNALTLEGILRKYPTTSIRNHTSRFGGYNIWKDLPLLVGGKSYSLEAIEHKVLRKMGEPRIHFAIVCASVGCPRLRNQAYTAERIDEQLAGNARDFFSRSQNFQIDAASGTLYSSELLKWFADDFGANQTQRFTYLKPYLPKPAQALAAHPRATVRYLEYDWNLNDQAKKPRQDR